MSHHSSSGPYLVQMATLGPARRPSGAATAHPAASAICQAIDAALAARDIKPATYVLLTVLANQADPSGVVTMSEDEMATRTSYSTRTVSRALRPGIAAGLIQRTAMGAGNSHGSRPATYQLLAPAIRGLGLTTALGSARKRPAAPPPGVKPPVRSTSRPSSQKWSRRYQDYLQSPAWQQVIDGFKLARPFVCSFSPDHDGCSGPIQLHHVTYERAFHEDLKDLMPICRWHHRQLHHHYESELRQGSSTSLRDFSLAWVGVTWPYRPN
jgi:hypothetical protein